MHRPRRACTAALLLTLLPLGACGDGDDGGGALLRGPPSVDTAADGEAPVLGQLPHFSLTDQSGGEFRMAYPMGRTWLASFLSTRCGACRTVARSIAALQGEVLAGRASPYLAFVTITRDPATDTPAVLDEYAREIGADRQLWRFLTGTDDAVRAVCRDAFGVDVGGPHESSHAAELLLVDSRGRLRGRYDVATPERMQRLRTDLAVIAEEPRHLIPPSSMQSDPPFDVVWPRWLGPREEAQRAAMADVGVFHDFTFEDRAAESGITFRHDPTPDGKVGLKLVHYDHGNGVISADVDLDGRYDLYFVNQVGRNELWRNLGGGRFEDVTERAGVALADPVGVTATFCDVDNDGDPDLYVTTVREGNVLFRNDGDGTFSDVTADSGLGYAGHSSSPVFFDYDRDGLTDMLLTNVGEYTVGERATAGPRPGGGEFTYWVGHPDAFAGHLKPARNEPSLLYRNLGDARFADVTAIVGLEEISWSGDATPIDVNEDGWLDIYVLDMQGNDDYWENVGGKSFVKRSREVFPKTPWGAMGVKVFDFDNDGLLDVYITDMHSDMFENVGPDEEKLKAAAMDTVPESLLQSGGQWVAGNAFFHNEGSGRYREISDQIGAENYWPWGLSIADLNADGFQDAFLTSSMNFVYRYGVNSLLLNDGGRRFVDAEFVLGVEPREGGLAKPWFELDGVNERAFRDEVYDGRVVLWDALGSRSSIVFDLDEDGDLDIVTSDWGSGPMVLISNLSERRDVHFLSVRLQGTKSNRDGLGARVTVHAGGRLLLQVHDGKSGYLSQSLLPLYFGLGDAERVERIEVVWPSGARQELAGPIEINRVLEIREP